MTRAVIDYPIQTRAGRTRLAPRLKPYLRDLGNGKAVGYNRRESGAGSWVVRERVDGDYRTRVIGQADDLSHADGRDVLTFEQALKRAAGSVGAGAPAAKLTVRVAVERYLDSLAARSDHGRSARQSCERHILPPLGSTLVERLSKTQVEQWLNNLVKDDDPDDEDVRRASQSTANRILTNLKAALNHAFADDKNNIASDTAWRRVKPFGGAEVAREDNFDAAEIRNLIAKASAADASFGTLLEVAYLTGARYGELVALNVGDFDAAGRIIKIRGARGGRKTGGRVVPLTGETVALLRRLADGRTKKDPLIPDAKGERWKKSEQQRPIKAALAAAKLPTTASFYALRHSHISRAIEAGMPLTHIAENCGTSLLMIQKHYAHVLARAKHAEMERTAPRLRTLRRVA